MLSRALAIVIVVASCSKPSTEPPPPASSPQDAVARDPIKTDLDLVARTTASVDVQLAAGAPVSRSVGVPAGTSVSVETTHLRGDLARISIDVFEPGAKLPITGNAITCAEPGCSFRSEIAVAPNVRVLTVTLTAEKPCGVRLAFARK